MSAMRSVRIYADNQKVAGRGQSAVAMRWNEFATTLTPTEHSRLVNAFTAGLGYTYLAARAAERNAAFALVRFRLGRARELLTLTFAMIEPSTTAPRVSGGVAPRSARRPTWQEFLERLPSADVERLQRAMADAVIDARLAADALADNGDLQQLSLRLEQSLRNLTLACDLCDGIAQQPAADADGRLLPPIVPPPSF
jgi:hypothetical protein